MESELRGPSVFSSSSWSSYHLDKEKSCGTIECDLHGGSRGRRLSVVLVNGK